MAVADLAERLDVDPSEIELVLQEDITWRDGSLGCPQPGMRYTQALVDGYRIVLRHGDTEYRYHGGGRRGPFLCEQPAPWVARQPRPPGRELRPRLD